MSHHNTEEKKTTADKVADFISNNRTVLWIALAVLLVAVVVFAIIDNSIEKKNEMYANTIVELQEDFQSWASASDDEKNDLETAFLDKTSGIVDTDGSNILVDKALFLRGQFYLQKEDWKSASEDFLRVADSSPDSYLASVCLYNGAAAKENDGDVENALQLLKDLTEKYRDISPILPEALFSMGRINEKLDDNIAAVAAYEDLAKSFPSSSWTNLAKTRIISLKASGVSQ